MPDTLMQEPPIEAIYFRDWTNSHIPEILEEIFIKEIYKPYVLGKRGLTIVDGGQNIGLASYYFKDYAKRVIGLEPAKSHREECTKMLEFNKVKNVEILPYALSNVREKRKFYLNANTTAYSLTELGQNTPYEEIETITIEDLFVMGKIEGDIDIFKADFEGEEGKIFASESFKKYMDRIPVILGEHHEWSGVSQNQFCNMFRDYGYSFQWAKNTKAAVFTAVRTQYEK